MPKERTLTRRDLNRALLARQLLLRRSRLSVPRAVERLGALQAQWPQSPYLALWSRLDGFSRDQLSRAVARRHVVKATLMRSTLHVVSARDYLAFAGLIRRARIADLERRLERGGFDHDLRELTARVVELASAEPRSRPDLLAALGMPKLRADDRLPWVVWHLLVVHAELVHSPESSEWRRHTAGGKFVPASSWLGGTAAGGAEAADHLVRRYLSAFGPASRADAAQWTGLAMPVVDSAFARLPLRRFRDERGRELVDLPRQPIPPARTEAPVRFLPMWDSCLLAHAERSRILPDELRREVIRRNGDIKPTFLVDGFVAGTWRTNDARLEIEPFETLHARARAAVARESKALEQWLAH